MSAAVWLTVREAAAEAGVDGDTIRRWADRGDLVHRRTAGGHRRIDRDDLLRLVGEPRRTQRRYSSPLDALDDWVAHVDDWYDWEPPAHVAAAELAALRVAVVGLGGDGGLVAGLRRLADRLTEELDRRDVSADDGDTTLGGGQLEEDFAHLMAITARRPAPPAPPQPALEASSW